MLDLATASPAFAILAAITVIAGIAMCLAGLIGLTQVETVWDDAPHPRRSYIVFRTSAAGCLALWLAAKTIPDTAVFATVPTWFWTSAKLAALCLAVVTVMTYIAGARSGATHRSGPVDTPGGGDLYDRPSVNPDTSNGSVQ